MIYIDRNGHKCIRTNRKLQQLGVCIVYDHFPREKPRDSATEDDERETHFRAENNTAGTAARRNLAVRNFRKRKADRKPSPCTSDKGELGPSGRGALLSSVRAA